MAAALVAPLRLSRREWLREWLLERTERAGWAYLASLVQSYVDSWYGSSSLAWRYV